MSDPLLDDLERKISRLKKITQENDRLLAKTILKMEDLHASNEALKSAIIGMREQRLSRPKNGPLA